MTITELADYEADIREALRLARIGVTSVRAGYWGSHDWQTGEIVVSVNLAHREDRENSLAVLARFGGCKRTEWQATPEDDSIFVRGYWAREDPWKCPGCGWGTIECDCAYPCKACFEHEGKPLPLTRERLLAALEEIEDAPDRGIAYLSSDLGELADKILAKLGEEAAR